MKSSVTTEDSRNFDEIRQAEIEGHRFFTVKINPAKVQGREYTINGLLMLRSWVNHEGRNGTIEKWYFNIESGMVLFTYDKYHRTLVAIIFDDDTDPSTRGCSPKLSKTGYNRNFFATHMDEGIFEIVDDDVREDVANRNARLKNLIENKEIDIAKPKAPEMLDANKLNLEEILEQEEVIKRKKKLILEAQGLSTKESPTLPPAVSKTEQLPTGPKYEAPLVENESPVPTRGQDNVVKQAPPLKSTEQKVPPKKNVAKKSVTNKKPLVTMK